MLRRISVTAGLVLAVGAPACGSDGGAPASDATGMDAPAPEGSADSPPNDSSLAEAHDSLPPAETSEPAAPANDDIDATGDSTPWQAVPPRELDLPSHWAETVAQTCLSDAELCPGGTCATFGGVLAEARRLGEWAARDYCVSEDGEPFITLGFTSDFGFLYAFRAGSGELVSRVVGSDVPDYCADTVPSPRQVIGRFIADCMWVRDPGSLCADEASPDLGVFENCLYEPGR